MKSAAFSKLLPFDQIMPTVDLAGYFQVERDFRSVYRNPSHHFILVETGWVEGIIAQRRFNAKAGTLICFRPTDRNEYRTSMPTNFYQAHITLAPPPQHRSTPFFPGMGFLPEYVPLGRAYNEMRDQFETFCMSLPYDDAGHRLRIQAAVFNMLRIMVGVIRPESHETVKPDQWERARWRLVSSAGLALKIHELAREMGLSVRHFDRMFRKRFGCSPKQYQMRARLTEARYQLCGTDASIKAIASDLGFANARNMTRMFQQIFGFSPSDLRHSVSTFGALRKEPVKRPYPVNCHLFPPGMPADLRLYLIPR